MGVKIDPELFYESTAVKDLISYRGVPETLMRYIDAITAGNSRTQKDLKDFLTSENKTECHCIHKILLMYWIFILKVGAFNEIC